MLRIRATNYSALSASLLLAFAPAVRVLADDLGLTFPSTPVLVASGVSDPSIGSSDSSPHQSDLEWAKRHHYKHWRRHVKPHSDSREIPQANSGESIPGATRALSEVKHVAAPKVSTPQPTLDSMTRDGSQDNNSDSATHPASTPSTSGDAASMDVGSAILRAVGALALVVAVILGVIYALRKKGYGVGSLKPAATQRPAATFGMNPWAVKLAEQARATKTRTPSESPHDQLGTDLQVLSTKQLPGSTISLYKIRAGDRMLLVGASANGTLSVLTEWDIETKPENMDRFEQILNTIEDAELGSDEGSVRDLSSRLGQTAERLSMIGSRPGRRE